MLRAVRRSVRLKVMFVVLVATLAALLATGVVLVIYDVRTHQSSWVNDLITQADLLGRATAPALAFQDTVAAHQNLALLVVRPQIVAAAIYTPNGARFATYVRPGADSSPFPVQPERDGYRMAHDELVLFHPIADADEPLGTVYLQARYELAGRLASYLPILGAVLLGSLLLALAMSSQLQAALTHPILDIAEAAHQVKERRDFSLRVPKTTEDETGELVEAFNDMLAEVGERTRALEEANHALKREMEVRQRAEEALRDANRRKDEFLATLAHELRNPLGPIRNAVQYLGMGTHDQPELMRTLALMDRQVQQMVRLIDDLLDISRITRNALELRPSTFRLEDLVQDVSDSCQHAADEAGHDLRFQFPRGVMLRADRARIAQAVCNLVNNAIKYTPREGRIEVNARASGPDLDLSVTDTGIGIPAEKLNEIFQPFSQLDRSLEKTQGGLGIGLALAQRLVALHGGSVSARSEGPGKGSTFRVVLPVVAAAGAPETGAPQPGPRSTARRSVLVADDNEDAAESMAMLLRAMGHDVVTADDGEKAYEKARGRVFDVAVLDIGMPRLNGYELAMRLRQLPSAKSMVLVALTGWGQAEDRQRALQSGFDHHLTKPVEPARLIAILESAPSPAISRAVGGSPGA